MTEVLPDYRSPTALSALLNFNAVYHGRGQFRGRCKCGSGLVVNLWPDDRVLFHCYGRCSPGELVADPVVSGPAAAAFVNSLLDDLSVLTLAARQLPAGALSAGHVAALRDVAQVLNRLSAEFEGH